MIYQNELKVAQTAAREAGKIIRNSYAVLDASDISEKRTNDMVTTVDIHAQATVISHIRSAFSDDYVLAEEALEGDINKNIDRAKARCWIIDPLDGTTNYVHAFPMFAVSIALEVDGEIVLGVTYDPLRDEMFHAVKRNGAFLNGNKMEVSKINDASKTLLGTGFPFRAHVFLDDYLKTFRFFFSHARGIRRAGSATLDFAYVASGRLDGFWEMTLSPWDIAAGVILIREAGGEITDFFGGHSYLESGHVVATNNQGFHNWMCEEIQKVFPPGGKYTLDD